MKPLPPNPQIEEINDWFFNGFTSHANVKDNLSSQYRSNIHRQIENPNPEIVAPKPKAIEPRINTEPQKYKPVWKYDLAI